MNSIFEKLEKAGFDIPKPKDKVDTSSINLDTKIKNAFNFIKNADNSLKHMNQAVDKENTYFYQDSVVLNFQRFCEAIKDILITICEFKDIKLSEKKSLSEVLRKTENLFTLDNDTRTAISYINERNDLVHDYINSQYYDEQVISHMISFFDNYLLYVECLEEFCKNNNLIHTT